MQAFDFTGKTVFVAGGTSGINLGIAEAFAKAGAKLAVVSRSQNRVDEAQRQLRLYNGEVVGLSADVRNVEAISAALKTAHDSLGEIDILLCGAAGNFPAPALGMSANGFKAVIDIDLLGTFNTCRAAFEHLRKPGASVISISATHAFTPIPMQAHVCAAKAGIDIFSKTLAVEWAPPGIRVNVISPGPVDDTEGMRRLAPTPEIREKVIACVPLRRFGSKDEIADLAL